MTWKVTVDYILIPEINPNYLSSNDLNKSKSPNAPNLKNDNIDV
jgi:hypothetical protein